jgi:hypothetical protein
MATLEELLMMQNLAAMGPQQPQITDEEINPSEKELEEAIRKSYLQSMQQQKQQAEAMRQMLAQEQQAQAERGVLGNLDLRPFAQAAKQYGATTAVVPAEAPEDRSAMLMKLRNAVVEAEQGMSKQQLDFLRSQLIAKQQRGALQAQQSEQNRQMRAFENVSRKFDAPQKEISDFYQAHDVVKSAFDSGDVGSIQMAVSNFARLSGEKGPLSDTDIARTIPDNLQQKFTVWWSKVKSDPKTPAPEGVLEALQSSLGRLRGAAETKARERIKAIERQTAKGPGEYKIYAPMVAEEAMQSIRQSEVPSGGMMSEAQKKRLEELKAKYGK